MADETKEGSMAHVRACLAAYVAQAERGCARMDAEAVGGAARAVRKACRKKAEGMHEEKEERDVLRDLVRLLARVMKLVSMKEHPEMLKVVVEALVELTSSENTFPNRERQGPDRVVCERAYEALLSVVHRRHGDVRELAALVLRALSPNVLLGAGGSGRQGKAPPAPPKWRWSVQQDTLAFVRKLSQSTPEAMDAVAGLARHVSIRCPDKAEYRSSAVHAISQMAVQMSPNEQRRLVGFMQRLSKATKPAQRIVAVESVGSFLNMLEGILDPSAEINQVEANSLETGEKICTTTCGQLCLLTLVQRSSDKIPSVRSRALACLVGSLEDFETGKELGVVVEVMKKTEHLPGLKPSPTKEGCENGVDARTGSSPLSAEHGGNLFQALLKIVHRRCFDEKAAVRKSAILLLSLLLTSKQKTLSKEDMGALEAACLDPLVSIRKVALGAVAQIADAIPSNHGVSTLWLDYGLPLVRDPEISVQERAMEMVERQLLQPLMAKQLILEVQSGALSLAEPPRSLHLLAGIGKSQSSAASIQQAFLLLAKQKRLDGKRLGNALQRLVEQVELPEGTRKDGPTVLHPDAVTTGIWVLLAEVAVHFPSAVKWRFLEGAWKALREDNSGNVSRRLTLVLMAIAHAAAIFPPEHAEKLKSALTTSLSTFEMEPSLIAAHVSTVASLSMEDREWGKALVTAAEGALQQYVFPTDGTKVPLARKIASALFTYGELALVCETTFKQDAVTLVQALLGPSLAGGKEVPHALQAHAWTALGKLCLIDEGLAKKCMPIFIQELDKASSAVVRNNVLVALSDLMVKYTALVDAHIMRLAALIQDPCEVIRRQSLVLLANLLQRDYLKWRVPLLQHVLVAVVDESPLIRGMAEHLMQQFLPTKAPLLVYNSFIEIMCTLNGCAPISSTGAKVERDNSISVPALQGMEPSACLKRAAIYKAMVVQMLPEHRLATAARLATEVLATVADGNISLEEAGPVVADALEVLSWKELRSMLRSTSDDDDAGAEAIAQAQGKLVAQVVKKNLVENIIPVLIQLKHTMENRKSPLLFALMGCLREIMKQYKSEVQVLLSADSQLAKEVHYDIRYAEEASSKVRTNEVSPTAGRSSPLETLKKTKTPRSARRSSLVGVTDASPLAAEVLQSAATDGLASPRPDPSIFDAPPSRRRSMLSKTPRSSPGSEHYKSMSVPRLRSRSRLGMALSMDGKGRRESFGLVQHPDSSPDENLDKSNKPLIPTPLPIRAYAEEGWEQSNKAGQSAADVILPSPDKPAQSLPKWNLEVAIDDEGGIRGCKRRASKSP